MNKPFIVILTLSILFITSTIFAEPVLINHQGRLTDPTGLPVNGLVELTFSFCAAPPPGCVEETSNGEWLETHSVDVADGLFSVILGSITSLDFSLFDNPVDSLWLQIQVGTDTPLSPTTRLTSVPMAAVASALQGGISTNNGVLTITDSLGDTTRIITAYADHIKDIYPPGNLLSTRFEPGAIVLTDSLGDTTITINSRIRQVGIEDQDRASLIEPGTITITGPPEDTTYQLLSEGNVVVEKFQHRQDFGPVQQNRQGVTDTSSFLEMVNFDDVDSSHVIATATESRAQLKTYFETGDVPTETRIVSAPDSAIINLGHTDGSRSVTVTATATSSGASLRMNKVDMVDDEELLALIDLNDLTGASFSLKLNADMSNPDNNAGCDIVVNGDGTALYMNKGELTDAIANGGLIVNSSHARLQLSKVDAGNALNAFASNTSVGLIIIDSTLNDSGLIGLQINDLGPNLKMSKDKDNGDGTTSKIEFTVLPDRIELARTAPGGTSFAQSCTLDMEKFTRASIDPADPDSTFVLNFATREMSLRTSGADGTAANRVEIADLDLDGTLDLRVDGNIGVGTSTPSEKLHVVGNICATGTIGACSDQRFKQNITSLTNPIGIINQLHGVSYNWKKDQFPQMKFNSERQIGFIAQEIKQILPSVVSKGADGFYTVDYGKLTPVLVEALKEQQHQIDLQQKQIDELKKLVQQLANNSNVHESSFGMK